MSHPFRLAVMPFIFLAVMPARQVEAQISITRPASAGIQRTVTLEDQLINRLRATTGEQQAFIRFVTARVREEQLDRGLVLAIERYALNRNRTLPFNYFERAIRFEASRRGLDLPPVQQFATTKVSESSRRTP